MPAKRSIQQYSRLHIKNINLRKVICGFAVCALCKCQLAAPAFHHGRLVDTSDLPRFCPHWRVVEKFPQSHLGHLNMLYSRSFISSLNASQLQQVTMAVGSGIVDGQAKVRQNEAVKHIT